MAVIFATVDEYRTVSGDAATDEARVDAMLTQQSAKLRAMVGITPERALTDDQYELCKSLVIDSCRKALVLPTIPMFGDQSMQGLTQATFSANGFSGSWQTSNGSGTAYFDRDTLRALKRSLGTGQMAGTILPSYGTNRGCSC